MEKYVSTCLPMNYYSKFFTAENSSQTISNIFGKQKSVIDIEKKLEIPKGIFKL